MLNEFLIWWGQQLLSLLPGRLRGSGGRGDAAVLALTADLSAANLTLRRRGREASLGRFALDPAGLRALRAAMGARPAAIVLGLPPGMVLEQSVVLPLAAEREPARVLRYEMDRLTPFQADDLFWTWLVARRDRARGQLHLALSLALRAPLRPVLDTLGTAGIVPGCLASGASAIPLDGTARRPWRRWVDRGLATACAALALAVLAAPFVVQSRESRTIERAISRSRPAVEQAEALRRRAASLAAGVDVLAAQRAASGDVIAALDTLTRTLPDDTSLSDLSIHARVVAMSGRSGAAARLVPILAADPALRGTAFAAPVTRNETTRTEDFTIRTEVVP